MKNALWIKPSQDLGEVCPVFKKEFKCKAGIKKAVLFITAMGVYEAQINGKAVGDFFMAPGWTSYTTRLQYQEYDVTDLLGESNVIKAGVGKGWFRGRLAWGGDIKELWGSNAGLLASLSITYDDGSIEEINTDNTWVYAKSPVLFSEIYDGEIYDARIEPQFIYDAVVFMANKRNLIPQEGEIVKDHESIKPVKVFTTPAGESVIDFGQLLTGRLCFTVNAREGDVIEISHAEILDKEGNFYTENLRTAKQKIKYICRDGEQTYKPHFTFMGFRYIRLDKFPVDIKPEDFTAIVAHSDMKRTGYFECSLPKLNRLFENIIWGQKGNFLDIPTDCPQRDERLGWTGDAQVFVRAAAFNYDVKRFFKKWLHDLATDQFGNGAVPYVVPHVNFAMEGAYCSTAWGDAAIICPWHVYLVYGDKQILADQYPSMRKWVEFMRHSSGGEFLWTGDTQLGDWLGLDAKPGDYTGASDRDFIATAFYAYSTSLLIKVSKILGIDTTEYERLYNGIKAAFKETYTPVTQTEYALTLFFDLAEDKQKTADALAAHVKENGNKLTTGFVGTPYLLHVLSENGHVDTAYDLLLQEEFPSWLFSVNMGATTMWEHWDGVNEDGTMWSRDMNSFNHYAYGAVADWLYCAAAGIIIDESKPGFEHVILKPLPEKRIGSLFASVDTKHGKVSSKWTFEDTKVKYEFEVPGTATVILGDNVYEVEKGYHSYVV